ncbi:MFS transporter [Streptomyces sp. NPDC060027]|uniref:MFS transporter n=1 Tax=Streptomyces sp. NPDC060027 TaxID=3347040 RepID=UPI003688F89E
MQPDSPWRNSDFRTLFTATAFGQLGTNIGYVAVPLIAVSALDASPGQVGALATLSTAAFLLIGLPAGAWLDRMRQRRVLIAADLARAGLYATIPLAWWLDALTLWQLYAVVLLHGGATVFADVGAQSVLPQLVGRADLVRANAAVNTLIAAGTVVGRGAGGGLVQLLTAPAAVVSAAMGHLLSALRLTAIRRTPPPPPPRQATRLGPQVTEGLRHVFGNRELRALALASACSNLGSQIFNTMLPVLFVRELGLPEGVLGLFWAAGGVGLLLGARCAGIIARRLGHGRALHLVGLYMAPAGMLVPFVDRGPWLWVAGTGWLLTMFKTGVNNVLGVSLRQRMTSTALLGRMNATFRFLLTGALAVGAAAAGVIGALAGVHTTLWAGGVFLTMSFLPILLSPVRTRRELPQQKEEERADRRPAAGAESGAVSE